MTSAADRKTQSTLEAALTGPAFKKRIQRRNIKNKLVKWGVSIGGIGVIFAVLMIMFFLLYVVIPLFVPASVEQHQRYDLPGGNAEKTLYYGVDEYKSSAMRMTESGKLIGFDLADGSIQLTKELPLQGQNITSFTVVNELQSLVAFGLSGGGVLLAKYDYQITYPNNERLVSPEMTYPYGKEILDIGDSAIQFLAIKSLDSELRMAYQAKGSNRVVIKSFSKTESMFSDSITLEEDSSVDFESNMNLKWLMLDAHGRNLYVISKDGTTDYYDLSDVEVPRLLQHVGLMESGEQPTVIRFLLGDYSLMIGTDKGNVYQWFPVRDDDNIFSLQHIRTFEVSDTAIQSIGIEKGRKGFAVTDAAGQFKLYNSTAERHISTQQVSQGAAGRVVMTPRSDGALVETQEGELVQYNIDNDHPDVSFSSLWSKVWYEGYSEPTYTWQSSSASADFEPKFSLMPLTFGTIKAAFYAMLFAVPIAILAAVFTAFFMDKQTRQWIKPTIEMIEALPTVILGFLAGLWLAPHMEQNLPGFFALLIVVPVGVIVFGYGWTRLPKAIRNRVPLGKRALLMIPVVVFLGWFSMQMSIPMEDAWFNGDMRHWLTFSAGIDFDQRNAMVIGFAMGFALIPTIFSVTEDAIYNVPTYLVNGSLALGASGWQTLIGVVIPTASPGIFSAVMLGFGRGVGETMIVLMASGNTPLMEMNLFEGMRTLAANLAIEMPEAAVSSSHYRVLFLAGLVLFIFTFVFNTLAEVVRQRMRRKYGSL
jgi:phosphate transport system permease protein